MNVSSQLNSPPSYYYTVSKESQERKTPVELLLFTRLYNAANWRALASVRERKINRMRIMQKPAKRAPSPMNQSSGSFWVVPSHDQKLAEAINRHGHAAPSFSGDSIHACVPQNCADGMVGRAK